MRRSSFRSHNGKAAWRGRVWSLRCDDPLPGPMTAVQHGEAGRGDVPHREDLPPSPLTENVQRCEARCGDVPRANPVKAREDLPPGGSLAVLEDCVWVADRDRSSDLAGFVVLRLLEGRRCADPLRANCLPGAAHEARQRQVQEVQRLSTQRGLMASSFRNATSPSPRCCRGSTRSPWRTSRLPLSGRQPGHLLSPEVARHPAVQTRVSGLACPLRHPLSSEVPRRPAVRATRLFEFEERQALPPWYFVCFLC